MLNQPKKYDLTSIVFDYDETWQVCSLYVFKKEYKIFLLSKFISTFMFRNKTTHFLFLTMRSN